MIRVLLLEDEQCRRRGLADLLAREHDIAIVGATDIESDMAGALPHRTENPSVADLAPQVVIVNSDYMVSQILPAVSGLRATLPACAFIVLSDPTKRGMLPSRRRTDWLSYLVKDVTVPTLAAVIRRVAAGARVIDPRLEVAAISTEKPVSTREWEVLGLAAQGESIADIAHRLFLSLGTVRNHISSVITKTGARNRLDAIRIARRDNWLH